MVNYLAILAAAIVGMIVGFVWYSPMLFGNAWIRMIGKDPGDKAEMERMKKSAGPLYGIMFVMALVSAYVFSRLMIVFHATSAMSGIKLAGACWLAFMLPVVLGSSMFSGKDKKTAWNLAFITGGHYLVGLLITGAILGAWR